MNEFDSSGIRGPVLARVAQAVALLGEWGGFCDSERRDGTIALRCPECPLGLVVAGHPEVCRLVETVLADVLGMPVHQRCRMDPAPQCHFEVETATG